MTKINYPPSTEADARNRAARTFTQGLAVDVTAAVALAVAPALSGTDFAWSKAYWLTVAGLAGKTAILSAVSYVSRKVKPPSIG